jgi:hypothetical protein
MNAAGYPQSLVEMAAQQDGGLNRRRFLRRLISFAAFVAAGRYDEALRAEESGSDSLGQVLPRRLLGRTGERVTMLGLGGFHIGIKERPAGFDADHRCRVAPAAARENRAGAIF